MHQEHRHEPLRLSPTAHGPLKDRSCRRIAPGDKAIDVDEDHGSEFDPEAPSEARSHRIQGQERSLKTGRGTVSF